MKIINDTIETFHRFSKKLVLAKNIADNLKTTNAKTPDFYITPKVHKKDVPGWPVVSSIDCHTSKLSKFVDHYVPPHAKALPSNVKDTTNFINKLENVKDISKDSILVTLDVKALYTNIPNHEGVETVKETLNSQAKKPIATRVIITFLYLILTQNNFVYLMVLTISKRKVVPWARFLNIYPYLRSFYQHFTVDL